MRNDCHDSDAVLAAPGSSGRPRLVASVIFPDSAVVVVFAMAVSSCAGVRGARRGAADAPDDSIAGPDAHSCNHGDRDEPRSPAPARTKRTHHGYIIPLHR